MSAILIPESGVPAGGWGSVEPVSKKGINMIKGDEFKERLSKLKNNVHMQGKTVDRFDPKILGGINVMAATYDLNFDPDFQDVGVAPSHLTSEKVNRFTHIHQSSDDLLNTHRK
jgi:4-hydroxybutyryl-CoA dehydratase / vinylacetyl-CoA-Delta-isomerase